MTFLGQDPIAGGRGVNEGQVDLSVRRLPLSVVRERGSESLSQSVFHRHLRGSDPFQLRQGLRRQRQLTDGQILAEVADRRRAGD
jgi:hypothetical protein